jgi:hypothetical protein
MFHRGFENDFKKGCICSSPVNGLLEFGESVQGAVLQRIVVHCVRRNQSKSS